MIQFAKATNAPQPRSGRVVWSALGLAVLVVAMLVAQLFTFEDFPGVFVAQFGIDAGVAGVVAALVVVVELFCLPFLLRMPVSPLLRLLSALSVWLWTMGWTALLVLLLVANKTVNTGVLGATIVVLPHPLVVLSWCVLAVFTAWVGWGLVPALSQRR